MAGAGRVLAELFLGDPHVARRDLEPMITHRFALDDFLDAFDVARSPDAGAKVMIEFN